MTKSIHFLILWTMLALAVAIPMAHAAKPELTGTYKVVGSNSCEINNVGFSAYPDLFALGPVFQVINTWESKMQFLANGQVIDVSSGQYAIPGFGQPVGTFETVCQYTSTANPDGSVTLTGECNDKVLSGIAKGVQDNIKPAVWKVMPASNDVILLSHTGTQVETQTNNLGQIQYRICQGHAIGAP